MILTFFWSEGIPNGLGEGGMYTMRGGIAGSNPRPLAGNATTFPLSHCSFSSKY